MAGSADATAELEFEDMGDPEFGDLVKQVEKAVADIHAGRCDSRLTELGLAKNDLADLKPEDFVVKRGQNLTGVEVAVVLIGARAGAKIGSKMVLDVWSRIVLPRLEQRYGTRVRPRKAHPKGH